MLRSLKNIVEGWRQTKTFRQLIEIITAHLSDDEADEASSILNSSRKEKLNSFGDSVLFYKSYSNQFNKNFAFRIGVLMRTTLCPQYRRMKQNVLWRFFYNNRWDYARSSYVMR